MRSLSLFCVWLYVSDVCALFVSCLTITLVRRVLFLFVFDCYVSNARFLCFVFCFVSDTCFVCFVFDCYVSDALSVCFVFWFFRWWCVLCLFRVWLLRWQCAISLFFVSILCFCVLFVVVSDLSELRLYIFSWNVSFQSLLFPVSDEKVLSIDRRDANW